MGMASLCLGWKIVRQHSCTTQVGTPTMFRDISWSLKISCRISISASQSSNWSYLTYISGRRSTNCMCKKVQSDKENLNLNVMNVQILRNFKIHQNYINFVLLNDHPTRPEGCHIPRDIGKKRDKKCLRWWIWHQLVLGDFSGCIINLTKIIVYFLNCNYL